MQLEDHTAFGRGYSSITVRRKNGGWLRLIMRPVIELATIFGVFSFIRYNVERLTGCLEGAFQRIVIVGGYDQLVTYVGRIFFAPQNTRKLREQPVKGRRGIIGIEDFVQLPVKRACS